MAGDRAGTRRELTRRRRRRRRPRLTLRDRARTRCTSRCWRMAHGPVRRHSQGLRSVKVKELRHGLDNPNAPATAKKTRSTTCWLARSRVAGLRHLRHLRQCDRHRGLKSFTEAPWLGSGRAVGARDLHYAIPATTPGAGYLSRSAAVAPGSVQDQILDAAYAEAIYWSETSLAGSRPVPPALELG